MSDDVGEVEPVDFNNVDELFEAVDRYLGCPEDTSGDYAFDAGDEHGLVTGRRCAESVVMAHSDNEIVIDEIQERMSTSDGGPLPMVQAFEKKFLALGVPANYIHYEEFNFR